MKKIAIFRLTFLFSFSLIGFSIIPIDESLKLHQKAFKDFEPYESSCNVDTWKYSSFDSEITQWNYSFDSIQASKSLDAYKKAYKELMQEIYSNAIIKGWLFGALTSWLDKIYGNYLLDEKVILLNLLGSIMIVLEENKDSLKEPYINPRNLIKHEDLFGTLDYHTGKRILIVMGHTQLCRMLSEFIIKR